VASEFLENAGAVVVVANNGAEALDLLHHGHFDGVLMDLQMPVMDGLEATRIIRANPDWMTMPVIAMTANALEEERRRCLEAGMSDFITKPVRPEILYSVLARWLAPGIAQGPSVAGSVAAIPGCTEDTVLIDFSALEEMTGGKREKVRELAFKFLAITKEDLDKLDIALERRDVLQVRDLGHHIKSPAAMIGAMGFAGLCRALETVQDDLDGAYDLVNRMRSQLAQLEVQIEHEFR
jgi:two-component system, sensor histidine kinase and response regulator